MTTCKEFLQRVIIEVCINLYKTINKLNPNSIRDLLKLKFTSSPACDKYKMNMIITESGQVWSYGRRV